MRYSHSKTQTVQTPTLLAKRDFIMSSEQQHPTSEFIQPVAYGATGFEGDDIQIDLHASTLVPIEVIRARQAIAAAVATAPSGSLEVNKIPLTPEMIATQKAKVIASVTWPLPLMRAHPDVDDLFAMRFRISSIDTQDDFGIAA